MGLHRVPATIELFLSSVVVLFFFVSAIETLIVVACHVLFVTTVWISENELRVSINISAAELKFNRNPAIHSP